MISAIVKAHKWQEEIDSGKVKSLNFAAKNGKNYIVLYLLSYISRLYRLILQAPDIIEAILAGSQPKTLSLIDLLKPFPVLWPKKRERFDF
ncbi:MAG: hypothetical protein EU981_02470 [Candidatus Liberibacter ctenarytainae]|uniref:Uncharacterized protein n=1 Tax=Candidatus Liberibacter ctenarytainae TaxID=2020335 RepID=A0A937AJQ4_9HYPH|nr:hypothetical protein [Candidatus Liberibacter ctenarytainae]